MAREARSSHPPARIVAEAGVACVAATLLGFAVLANHRWLDWHMLPDILIPRWIHLALLDGERILAVAIALSLLFLVRPRIGRWAARSRPRDIAWALGGGTIALILALGLSEVAMRWITWREDRAWAIDKEPLRRSHPVIGWENIPNRVGQETFKGRRIRYVVDRDGHRVADLTKPVDYERPSILYVGESIMFGSKLNWAETVPGQVQAMTGIQSANLAINVFATDQNHMHLARELPKFRHPVAIVVLFAPTMLERNLRSNRPHLDDALRWQPPREQWRLQHLARIVFPFHRRSTIEQVLGTTRTTLKATAGTARARDVPILLLIPTFMPEEPNEKLFRDTILQGTGIPHIVVPLDADWRLWPNFHPDARADHVMALAVASRLKQLIPEKAHGERAAPIEQDARPEQGGLMRPRDTRAAGRGGG
jgi:hypothetical protein